jgi:small subunit ribosomal protein S6
VAADTTPFHRGLFCLENTLHDVDKVLSLQPQNTISMNTKTYETVIILTPVLSEQQMQEAVAGYRGLITDNGGEIVHEENWGLTKLAYPIDKKGTGFYHLFEYKADSQFIKTMEIAFRRDERLMRYLTVKLDKWAIEFNQKKRNGELHGQKMEAAAKAAAKKKVELENADDE